MDGNEVGLQYFNFKKDCSSVSVMFSTAEKELSSSQGKCPMSDTHQHGNNIQLSVNEINGTTPLYICKPK